jgi:hypothetical protein
LVSVALPFLNDYKTYFNSFTPFTLESSEYSEQVVEEKYKEVLTIYIYPGGLYPTSTSELDPEFFSPEDIYHLQDVRGIYTVLYILTFICVVILIWSCKRGILRNESFLRSSKRILSS